MIIFKKLRFKNILSYGNYWTEIDFLKHHSVLISGKNGTGKSTACDALCFALFGTPYRDINKPNLVNSVNEKDCLVELDFDIGSKQYQIRRGIKPSVFEIFIDGKMVDQSSTVKDYQKHLEQNILRLNYKSFTQLVLLGSSSYVSFMQLPAADRREVIEELLDIRVFSKMNIVLKEKMSLLKEETKSFETELEVAKQKIALQKGYIDKLRANASKSVLELQNDIQATISKIEVDEKAVSELREQTNTKKSVISDEKDVATNISRYRDAVRKLNSKILETEKDIDFYKNTDQCPTCTQQVNPEFRELTVSEKNTKVQEIRTAVGQAEAALKNFENRYRDIQAVVSDLQSLERTISSHLVAIGSSKSYLSKLQSDISKISTDTQDVDVEDVKLETMRSEFEQKSKQKDEFTDTRYYYEIAQSLLKDTGIKTKIIRQYLPMMNKYINKYLSAMDFFVNFNLDENFDEIIKSRHRDEFEYNSFSEGEKFRIDMALLLTWREVAKAKNSTNTNIMFLDEVFDSSLDVSGTESFLRLIKDLSRSINIFVISHKPDTLSDKFEHHMKVEKRGNFSYVVD